MLQAQLGFGFSLSQQREQQADTFKKM